MKFVSLEIIADGPAGWGSGVLEFGDQVTQLFGDNGAGKTPVVQSIVFALGYPASFREDINERCKCVVLTVVHMDQYYAFRRPFKGAFLIEVSNPLGGDSETLAFHSEADFSRYIFQLWGWADPVLVSVSGAATRLYVSQVLPLFYLDQDEGYSSFYFTPSRFIKDQYAEVMRSVFGLPAKNPFEQRKLRRELQERLERLDLSIVRRQRTIGQLASDVTHPRRSEAELSDELAQVQRSFESLRQGGDARSESEVTLDGEIALLRRRVSALIADKAEHRARLSSFLAISNEIEIEANTLSLNEEARAVFASFDSVCANQACGLFVRSSESYGKSLLYLKDQLKDLERSRQFHEDAVARLDESLVEAERELGKKVQEKELLQTDIHAASLVDATALVTERLIVLKKDLLLEAQLHEEEQSYVAELDARSRTHDELSNVMRGPGNVDLVLLKVKSALEERIRHWLSVLHAVNMPKQIAIDSDFGVDLVGDNFKAIKGSTKTRLVLAVRTAALEILLMNDRFSPRFFLLDTPRQQDIKKEDFANYVAALKQLSVAYGVQIVFSSSNYRYDPDDRDQEWPPRFEGVEQAMYLG
ncbi:hypothetical protein [Stenotrophomonas maltophilia]|uniref:hypothetical protein n=1 Tax=Stenotrophomonas maltophilia TaxID=40324 RepID=UPI00066CA8EE|nr:hypothetical protein [Stenotrophomonas maltophilia]HDS1674834.1 hypothetical protein [Stenotrophomonas maltophilia]